MQHNRGLTMVEALVLMFVIVVLLAVIIVPFLGSARGPGRRMPHATQIRAIHQSVVLYAQANDDYFPGLDHAGHATAVDVSDRFGILIRGNYLPPAELISPAETGRKQEWSTGSFTRDNYSYAMLQLPTTGGRRDEWFETLNTNAIVLADRNTGTPSAPASIHTNQSGDWRGVVAHNDNSVSFETTHLLDTDYAGHAHLDDHLFEAAGDDDAYLIHSGN